MALLLATLLLPLGQAAFPSEEWFLIEDGRIQPAERSVNVGDTLYVANLDEVSHTVLITALPNEQGVLNGTQEVCLIEPGGYCKVTLSAEDWGETEALISVPSIGAESLLTIRDVVYSSPQEAAETTEHVANDDVGAEARVGTSAGPAPAWGAILILCIIVASLLHYMRVRRADTTCSPRAGASRTVLLVLTVLLAAPIAPAVAEWCWNYTDDEPAMNPQPWECNSSPPTPEAAADEADLSLQRIADEHMNWHCTNGHLGGAGSGPGFGDPGYGEQFLVYHKQEIYAFDQFREGYSLENIEIWDPNTFTASQDNYNPMPWGVPGCQYGDLNANGECPDSNPGVTPAQAGGLGIGECIDGDGRSGNGVDESTFVQCPSCLLLPEAYRWPALGSIASADDLGDGLDWESGFHGDFHGGISNAEDADENYCGDAGPVRTAPRDSMFWRAHKALDEVHHQWMSYQAADVVVLLDRSGSMVELADPADASSGTKMDAAKSAASFFSDVMEDNVGNTVGALTFSTNPSAAAELPLAEANAGSATAMQQALSSVQASGLTGIGAALISAQDVLDQGPNDRKAILLLTDGMENQCPRVQDPNGVCDAADFVDANGDALNDLVTDALGDTQVCSVGLGGEASLDGLMLSNLSERQGGIYRQGVGELQLKKFFLRCFSTIFNYADVQDPVETLLASEDESPSLVASDHLSDGLTFVLVWESGDKPLRLSINTPSGEQLDLSHRDIESSTGPTWHIVRVPVRLDGEEQGEWKVSAVRTETSQTDQQYFLDVLASGGPRLEYDQTRLNTQTGDTLRVKLRIPAPTRPIDGFDSVSAQVTITSPTESIGALLSQHGLRNSSATRSEPVGPVQATLEDIWNGTGGNIGTKTATYQLYDDGTHGDLFANNHYWSTVLPVPARYEGHYELYFEVEINYKQTTVRREMTSTLYVSPGIDPASSTIQVSKGSTNAAGDQDVEITLNPQDLIGNPLGPGRPHVIGVELGSGVVAVRDGVGTFVDLSDGRYLLNLVLSGDAKEDETTVKLTQNGRRLYLLNLATGDAQTGPGEVLASPEHVHLNSTNTMPPSLEWELQATDGKIEPGDSVFVKVDARDYAVVNFGMQLDISDLQALGTDRETAVLSGNYIRADRLFEFVLEVQVPEDAKEGDKFKIEASYGLLSAPDHRMKDMDALTIEVGKEVKGSSGGGGGLPGWSVTLLVSAIVAAGVFVERKRTAMRPIRQASGLDDQPA